MRTSFSNEVWDVQDYVEEITRHEEETDYVETMMDDRNIDYRIIDVEWKITG